MLESLYRRPRGLPLARALSAVVPSLAGTDEPELRRRAAELDRREADLATHAASVSRLDQAVAERLEQLPPWSPGVHDAPVRPVAPGPVTKALYDRLDDDDLRALEAAFDEQTAAYWANADPVVRPYLALHFSAYHGVTRILDKTGMSASMPPDDIHAMARGPVAAGGDPWIADLVVEVVERAGGSLGPGMRGLDFGCSSGRVVRVLAAALPEVAWSGCDPNAGAIGWASEALPGIDFFVSPQEPPLELPDGELDLIYAISIWSHFGADAGLRWLDEMHRLLRPGGLLVVTTHGLSSLGKQIESGAMVRDTALACSEALYRSGFWYADVFGEEGDHGVVSQEWGMAYMTPEWLLSRLLPSWRALLYEPARLDANQDVYVLERR